MSKLKKIYLFLILMILSFSLYAGGWSGFTKVSSIYPHSTNNIDGTMYFTFGTMINPGGCANSSLIALKKSNNLSSEMYSLILLAFTSGKQVNYYASGCGTSGYPEMLHVRVVG